MTKPAPLARPRPSRLSIHLALAHALLGGGVAHALPTGEAVRAGQVRLNRDGSSLRIDQLSQRAIVDWQSFGIGADERVRLVQPGRGVALFRVMGGQPSRIFGRLEASGSLFLSNANGVLFGRGSQVDVGSLVATTRAIADHDFSAGRYRFSGASHASVVNQGEIRADGDGEGGGGGYLVLLGESVDNRGSLQATGGSVALGAARTAQLDLFGDGLVKLQLSGDALDAVVNHSGRITADGGAVQLATQARHAALNVSGVVQANTLVERGGVIRLEGGATGTTVITGRLEARGLATGEHGGGSTITGEHGGGSTITGEHGAGSTITGEHGGEVTLTGKHVGLFDRARIDVNGPAGGGTVLVGGDYQGRQGRNASVPNADKVVMGADARISADATTRGDGGKVILWADDSTRFDGHISARGGDSGGNGGFVETSGKATLQATGGVDAAAPRGQAGQWLLDPNNITIQTGGANTNVGASPSFTSTDDDAIVTVASITTALNAGTSVTVTAASAGANTQSGNITVANAIGKTAGGAATLTLNAANDLTVNGAITSTVGALGINLNAPGAITLNAGLTSLGGAINLNGGSVASTSAISSAGGTNAHGGNIAISTSGAFNSSSTLNANAGAASAGNLGRNAGNVTVDAAGGSIVVGNVTAGGSAGGAGAVYKGGNGGHIALTGHGGVNATGVLAASGGAGVGSGAAGGDAGSVALSNDGSGAIAVAGTVSASAGAGVGAGLGGAAGSVTFGNHSASGAISAAAITTTGSTNGHAGTIQIDGNGSVTVSGAITALGGAVAGGSTLAARHGGDVTITGVNRSLTSVATSSGNASGSNQAGANGGAISITGTGTLATGALTATAGAANGTGAGGAGGNITLSGSSVASSGAVGANSLDTSALANGRGGSINVSSPGSLALGALTTSGGAGNAGVAGGNAGDVTLNGDTGITVDCAATCQVTAHGGAAGAGSFAGGAAGHIDIVSNHGALLTRALQASAGAGTGTAAGGAAGSVSVLAQSFASSGSGSVNPITTSGNANADAGSISVTTTTGALTVRAMNANAGTALTGTRGRNGGNITLNSASAISASTVSALGADANGADLAGGNGGTISITGVDGLNVAGVTRSSGGAGLSGNAGGGSAGNITLANSGSGQLRLQADLSAQAGSAQNAGAAGTAGRVELTNTAAGGALITTAITTTGGAKAQGGAVALASQGSVTTGAIATSGGAGAGANAPGLAAGSVAISAHGNLTTGAITSNGGDGATTNGAGGNAGGIDIVNLATTGDISVGALSSATGNAQGSGAGGAARAISVVNHAGSGAIGTGALNTVAGINGNGGAVVVAGQGSVTIGGTVTTSGGSVLAFPRAGGKAGNVTIEGGSVTVSGAITASGSNATASNQAGGDGGQVSITTTAGNLGVAAITASTGNASTSGASGQPGFINLDASGNVATGALTTSGGANGQGGEIWVAAGGNATITGTVDTTGGASGAGAAGVGGGSLWLHSGGAVNTGIVRVSGAAANGADLAGGASGSVDISAGIGVSTGSITARGGNAGSGNGTGGDSGMVTVYNQTSGNIALNGSVSVQTGDSTGSGGAGNAGTSGFIWLQNLGPGDVLIPYGLSTYGAYSGSGGDITVLAQGLVSTGAAGAKANLIASASPSNPGNAGGHAGNITIDAGRVDIGDATSGRLEANGSAGNGLGQRGGNGGSINLTARQGGIAAGRIEAMGASAGSGDADAGNAGSVSLINQGSTGAISAGVVVAGSGSASGLGAGGATGLVTMINQASGADVRATSVTTTGGANGDAGKVVLAGTGLVQVTNGIQTNAGGHTGSTGNGHAAGDITLQGASVTVNGLLSAVGSTGHGTDRTGGNGGDIWISATNDLTLTSVFTDSGGGTGRAAGGTAGAITLQGGTTTRAAVLNAVGGTNGSGGDISMRSSQGSVTVSYIDSSGGDGTSNAPQGGGDGGAVTVEAAGAALVGRVVARGGYASGGGHSGGNGGAVRIASSGGTTDVGQLPGNSVAIFADGGGGGGTSDGGDGGAVTLLSGGSATPIGVYGNGISNRGGDASGGGLPGAGGHVSIGSDAFLGGDNGPAWAIASYGGNNGLGRGGDISFLGRVNSGSAFTTAASFNTNGSTTFNGAVGDVAPFSIVATDDVFLASGGTTFLNGGSLFAYNGLRFRDRVSLGADTTMATSSGDISFDSLLSHVEANGHALTFDTGSTDWGNVKAVNAANDFASVSITNAAAVWLVDANALTLGTSRVNGIVVKTGGDLTLAGNVSAVGLRQGHVISDDLRATDTDTGLTMPIEGVFDTDAIVLAAGGNFRNPGNAALTVDEASSRWLVYSGAPNLDDRGSNVIDHYAFKHYGVSFGDGTQPGYTSGAVASTGNGLVYRFAPSVGVTVASASKVYDANIDALGANLVLARSGVLDGDSVVIGGPTAAEFDDRHAGSGIGVTAYGLSLGAASNGARAVYGYTLGSTTASGSVGVITPAALTVTAVADSRVYDGTTLSSGAPTVGTLLGSDSIATAPTQRFGDRNAGSGKALIASGLVIADGNGGADYTVSYVASNAGTIARRALVGSVTAQDKVADGSTAATLVRRDLSGVVSGDAVQVVGGSAAFDDAAVGTGKRVVASGLTLGGADAGNYTVNASAVTTASITAPVHPRVDPPVEPPVRPPVNPPVNPPVEPPVTPPVTPPVKPPVEPPVRPPVEPPVTPPVTPSPPPAAVVAPAQRAGLAEAAPAFATAGGALLVQGQGAHRHCARQEPGLRRQPLIVRNQGLNLPDGVVGSCLEIGRAPAAVAR